MARFPHYRGNAIALGKLLADARLDPNARTRLLQDPKRELKRIGLPESVVELIKFKIVDDSSRNAVALPYRLNEKRLRERDPSYLSSIATNFSGAN